jgi:protein-disulfide isomerase
MENRNNNFINLPSAIIIAGTIIAIAIIYVKKPVTTNVVSNTTNTEVARSVNLSPVTSKDNILGNPSASIKIVEYSDPSCPFCKVFNGTMHQIMEKYEKTGKVAWVYRSLPLDTPDSEGRVLHKNARKESQAIECAGIVGGQKKFWEYQKKLYEVTPAVTQTSPEGLDQKQLPLIAKDLGINTVDFSQCVDSEQAISKVKEQELSGINAGVTGTPTSFFVLDKTINPTTVSYIKNALVQYRIPEDLLYVSDDKKMIAMSGAMPVAMVTGIIESLLK